MYFHHYHDSCSCSYCQYWSRVSMPGIVLPVHRFVMRIYKATKGTKHKSPQWNNTLEKCSSSSIGFYFLNQKTRIFSWRTGPSILILPVFPSGNCSTCFSFSAPYCVVLSTWIYIKPWLHPQCCHLGHSPLGLAPQLSPTSQPQTTPTTLHRAAKAQIWASLSSATNPSVAPRMTFNIPSQSRPSFPDVVTPSSSHAKLSLELQTFLGPWTSPPASPLPRTLLTSTPS